MNTIVAVETKMRFKNVIYTNLNRPTVPSSPLRKEKRYNRMSTSISLAVV